MKLPNPYACDICKRQKQDANKWFKAYLLDFRVVVTPWDVAVCEDVALADNEFHLCGEACVHEWISRNLNKIN